MTNLLSRIVVLLFLSFSATIIAQDANSPRFYKMDYMSVSPGMHTEYEKLESTWKKLHQIHKNEGKIEGWALESIMMPSGSSVEYNYVTRITFSSTKQMADYLSNQSMPESFMNTISPEEKSLMKRTDEIRTWVKSEIWTSNNRIFTENFDGAKVAVFNYFRFPETGGRMAHREVENEIWKPIHEARINDGSMLGWVAAELLMPGGSQYPYKDATVDLFDNLEQAMNSNPIPYFEKIHAGKNVNELLKKTNEAADRILAEVRIHEMSLD